jgi:8-oxo-dGTP pyrophosphatase MutT (NUDIX family)
MTRDPITMLGQRHGSPKRILCRLPSIEFPPVNERAHGEVCMAILRPNGRFLLHTKRSYPNAVMRLPSGGIKPGEDIEHALKREIWEETNLDCTIDRFVAVLQYEDMTTRAAFRTNLFLVREISGVLQSNDPTEHITQWCEVAPGELLGYARILSGMNSNWSNWGLFRAAALETLAGYCQSATL